MPLGGEIFLETNNVIISEEEAESNGLTIGRFVKISIEDTGTGMDKETLLRIFNPYNNKEKGGLSTGPGLAAVYGIIRNHGGVINVCSEKNRGTTFNVFIPAKKHYSGHLHIVSG